MSTYKFFVLFEKFLGVYHRIGSNFFKAGVSTILKNFFKLIRVGGAGLVLLNSVKFVRFFKR